MFLTRTKSPVLMLMLSSLKEEKWTLSSWSLVGGTGSLVHWNTGLCLLACVKYLLRVIMSSDESSESRTQTGDPGRDKKLWEASSTNLNQVG